MLIGKARCVWKVFIRPSRACERWCSVGALNYYVTSATAGRIWNSPLVDAHLSLLQVSHRAERTLIGRSASSSSHKTHKNKKSSYLNTLLESMPKQRDVSALQEIRRKAKAKKYDPATVYIQVVGSGAVGSPGSLYVSSGADSYLFNPGEGTQRVATEHKAKLAKIERILVTHKSWKNVGGLMGMLLSMQDSGVPEITLHGPPGINSLCKDVTPFIWLKDLHVAYEHYSENNGLCGQDGGSLIIHSIPLWARGESMEKKTPDSTSTFQDEDQNPSNNPKQVLLEESKKSTSLAVAYVCRPPLKKGRLNAEMCVRAGVPPGPLLGVLKDGKDVTLPNGKIIRAADVCSPDCPGPVFIVVEAPSEAYLDALLDSPAFTQYQSSTSCDADIAEVVVHFTPQAVLSDPRYQEWMSRFTPSTNHIVINDASSCMGLVGVHAIQYKLNLLSDNLFPLLKDKSIPLQEEKEGVKENGSIEGVASESDHGSQVSSSCRKKDGKAAKPEVSCSGSIGPVIQACTNLCYSFRPKKMCDRSNEPKLTPKSYIQECYNQDDFEAALLNAKSQVQAEQTSSSNVSQNYPNVIFLGTGSSKPSKTRNCSSILLTLSEEKSLLMDTGEGTYGQLVRLLGVPETNKVLRSLTAVYISHLHADHHMGFIALLLARRKAFHESGVLSVPKLLLLAPQFITQYLTSYDMNYEPILHDFTLIQNDKLVAGHSTLGECTYSDLCSQLDMTEIKLTYVLHCKSAFGVAWTHKDGWKVVYSGDTMPCTRLIDIGKDCDLLIHEATMEDELEEEARLKTHSTTSQAIEVGKKMNARYTLLTHFSQRYSKIPIIKDMEAQVGIAHDNMKVCLNDLQTLHHFYPPLKAMFAEVYEESLKKTEKYVRAREEEKQFLTSLKKKQRTE